MAGSSLVGHVNAILNAHAMRGQGRWFVYYAAKYRIDLGLLIGIAGAETTWGDAGTGTPGSGYGAFGVGPKKRYGSYKEAIADAAKNLGRPLYRKWVKPGQANPAGMMPTYVGYTSHDWLATVSKYANTFKTKGGGKGGGGGSYYRPVKTPMGSSDFAYVDKEGAPDKNGVRHHAAHDWFGVEGGKTPVFSPVAGKIVEVKQATTWSGQVFGGTVKVQASNGMVFVFRHVMPGKFKLGQRVNAGAQIARIGPWTDGPDHTHVEIWKTLAGGYHYENMIDPVAFFSGKKWATPSLGGGADTGAGIPDTPAQPQAPAYKPHYYNDLGGSLGAPGQDPIIDPGRQPQSIARLWSSLAQLPNASPETLTFADRANLQTGGF